jgi:hypothetical protein
MVCSICLENIENDHIKKKLSCNHVIHFKCYLELVYRDKNLYITCPLCREVNTDISRQFDGPEENIMILCKDLKRCRCTTASGRVCKRKPSLLNYGYCYQHNPTILKKHHYPLMEKYIYLILCQRGSFYTKLKLIDLGKKIICKYCTKDSSIDEILEKYYRFFSVHDVYKLENYDEVYSFYELDIPDERWIDDCNNGHYII